MGQARKRKEEIKELKINMKVRDLDEELLTYVLQTLMALIKEVDTNWKTDVKDCNLAVVYPRTLVRSKKMLLTLNEPNQLLLLEQAMKLTDKEIYYYQVQICNNLGIKAF